MIIKHFRVILLLTVFLVGVFPNACMAESLQLDRGVEYTSLTRTNSGGNPVVIHVVDANLDDTRVEPRVVMADGGLGSTEVLSSMAADNMAVAGINGGYFSMSKRAIPTDTFILDGRIISKGMRDPAAFGLLGKEINTSGYEGWRGRRLNSSDMSMTTPCKTISLTAVRCFFPARKISVSCRLRLSPLDGQ
jgi:hypothetical protein